MTAVRERRLGNTQGATRFWWIRHAMVPASKGGRISGQADLDCDLSDTATIDWLRGQLPPGDYVFASSPLKRAVKTGEAVTGRAPDETDPRLMEQNFGEWTGHTWAEVNAQAEKIGFWKDPVNVVPPGGESFAAQCTRVAAWIVDACERHAGRDIVVAAHGGTIRAAVAHSMDLPPDLSEPVLRLVIDNLSLTRINALQEGAAVVCVNELPKHKD